MATRRRTRNLLAGKTANVSIHRNGVSVEIPDVPAGDCALVAQALLDAMRQMVKAGYDELIPDAGGVHSGPLGEVADDAEYEEAKARRVGFVT